MFWVRLNFEIVIHVHLNHVGLTVSLMLADRPGCKSSGHGSAVSTSLFDKRSVRRFMSSFASTSQKSETSESFILTCLFCGPSYFQKLMLHWPRAKKLSNTKSQKVAQPIVSRHELDHYIFWRLIGWRCFQHGQFMNSRFLKVSRLRWSSNLGGVVFSSELETYFVMPARHIMDASRNLMRATT